MIYSRRKETIDKVIEALEKPETLYQSPVLQRSSFFREEDGQYVKYTEIIAECLCDDENVAKLKSIEPIEQTNHKYRIKHRCV